MVACCLTLHSPVAAIPFRHFLCPAARRPLCHSIGSNANRFAVGDGHIRDRKRGRPGAYHGPALTVVSPPSTVAITEGLAVTVRASASDAGEARGLLYQWQLARPGQTFNDMFRSGCPANRYGICTDR